MEVLNMEEVYAAMLLHKGGKKIEEGSVKKVLDAAGISVDESRIRALVATLEGVDIDQAIKEASMPVATAPSSAGTTEAKKEIKEEKKTEAEAAAGLGALFG